MRKQFDIKFRPQIESGEYKVMLDCGVEAEILAWDKPGEYPIVCMAKKEGAIPFRTDSNGRAYHYPEGSNYSDLFIIIPEPELTEFEQAVRRCIAKNLTTHAKGGSVEVSSTVYIDDETTKKMATELLELARKEFDKQIENDFREIIYGAYEKGKDEVLKDLPRWRKWENGACGNGRGIPLAIVKRGLNGYELVDALGITGEQYIMLSDLEKLPGFKEG